jgi:replicative DNA helicase
MVSAQVLSKVLASKEIELITANNLTSGHFIGYEDEFNFILNHYEKYHQVPDKETFLAKFPDFELFEVTESNSYLINTIQEEYLYYKSVPVVQTVAKLLETDANKAVEYLLGELPNLTLANRLEAIDLISQAEKRYDIYQQKKTATTPTVIKTGLIELDELVYGWEFGEELVTIVGRTNQGKSWLLQEFLKSAWQQGYRVGLYSGEMSATKVGYRIDALINHFSNTNLIRGHEEPEYADFINWLSQQPNPFYIITRKELGGKATIPKLRAFVESNKIDILGIDQYSLMEDSRKQKGDPKRTQLDHITDDLMQLSSDYGIPVIGLAQSNRLGVVKIDDEDAEAPDVDNISESDAIGQNSSRVIGMRQTGAGLEMIIRKNREGKVGGKVTYFWDIDRGTFKYIPSNNDSVGGAKKAQETRKQYKDCKDVF